MRVDLFSQLTSDRIKGYIFKVHQWRFKLDIRKDFFSGRVVKDLNRLPMEVMESLSLEIQKMCRASTYGKGLVLDLQMIVNSWTQ